MIIVCVEGCYSDTRCMLVEHHDIEEALAVLALLEPYDGPEPVCSAPSVVLHDEYHAPIALTSIVGTCLIDRYRHGEVCRPLAESLPLGILRAAAESAVAEWQRKADYALPTRDIGYVDNCKANVRALREALAERERREQA